VEQDLSQNVLLFGLQKTSGYIAKNLMTTLDERNVSNVIQMYAIGAREPDSSPQHLQVPINPSLSRLSSIRTER